jgi:hypothetical protein
MEHISRELRKGPGVAEDSDALEAAARSASSVAPHGRLHAAESFVLASLPLLAGAILLLLRLLSWEWDFRPQDHAFGYWTEAIGRIRTETRIGAAFAVAAGAACITSLALPHRLRISGWAILLLSTAGLLLGAVLLVGTHSADSAFQSSTSP